MNCARYDRAGIDVPRQFALTTRAHVAVDDATGEPIGLDHVDTRVGWLLDLVTAAGAELLSRLWHPATFDVLAAGRDHQDRKLPAQGHVAAARLKTAVRVSNLPYPDGSRHSGRLLRGGYICSNPAVHRAKRCSR